MRGLKPVFCDEESVVMGVASFTDAWIETPVTSGISINDLSHLLQMRGLKHVNMSVALILSVASFTDAWIETLKVTVS